MNLSELARKSFIHLLAGERSLSAELTFSCRESADRHTAARGLFYGVLFEAAGAALVLAVCKLIPL